MSACATLGFAEHITPESVSDREFAVYQKHRALYRWAARFTVGREVLDAGCGAGFGCSILAENAQRVIGIDLDTTALMRTSGYAKAAGNVYFAAGDVLRPCFAPGSFDVIVSFEVIEHLRDVGEYLEAMKSLLRKDAVLLLSTPNKKMRPQIRGKPCNPYHVREYTCEELLPIVRGHFSDVEALGIRGNERAQRQELDRLFPVRTARGALLRAVTGIDFLRLRRLFPREARDKLARVLFTCVEAKERRLAPNYVDARTISESDFYVTADTATALNLVFACRKTRG